MPTAECRTLLSDMATLMQTARRLSTKSILLTSFEMDSTAPSRGTMTLSMALAQPGRALL